MASKYNKKSQLHYVTHTETPLTYHLSFIRLISKNQNLASVGKEVKKGRPLHIVGRTIHYYSYSEKQSLAFSKIKKMVGLQCDLAISTLVHIQRK